MKNFLKLEYLCKSFLLNLVFSMLLIISSIFITKNNLVVLWVSGWFFGWALNDLIKLFYYISKDLSKKRKRRSRR